MHCPACATEVADASKFCSQCGTKLPGACPRCQAPVQSGQRFCGQCGTPLDAPEPPSAAPLPARATTRRLDVAARGDRRVVTVLFTDVSGFTAMSERLDPEQVTEIVNNFFKVLVEPIYRYGGVVDKFIGDAIMALFGAPVAHEDDPERAVRAAWEMQLAAGRHAAELHARTGIGLKVRIGLNTGLVVAGAVGGSQRSDYTVMGDTVNLAQRMEANASPGKVLVTAETWSLTRQTFDYQALDPIAVKGKAAKVPIYELAGPKAQNAATATDDGLFLGREAELTRLEDCARQEGSPRWVHVVGDMGVGKSALVRRFVRSLKGRPGIKILWGRALSYDQQPYLVPANVLRYWLGLPHGAPPSDIRAALLKLCEEAGIEDPSRSAALLAHLLAIPADHLEVASLSPKQLRSAAFLALNEILTAPAWVASPKEEAPGATSLLVLALEDLHWADDASLEWIAALADHLQARPFPILVVCQSRPDSRFLAQTQRQRPDHLSLALATLEPQEAAALASALLGVSAEALEPAVRNLLDQVLSRAEGNPFYLSELVRSLQEAGVLVRHGATWALERPDAEFRLPSTVQGAIAARLDCLDADLKRLLQVAAVLGRTFDAAMLAAVLGSDPSAGLAALTGGNFLYRQSTGEHAFTQAIIQEVAYQNLLLATRRDLHRRVGEVVEATAAGDLGAAARTLAYHYVHAEIADKACRYLYLAADRARASYAVAESLAFYRQAFEWYQAASSQGQGVDREALLTGMAAVEIMAGDLPSALAHLEDTLQAAPTGPLAPEAHRLLLKALIRKGDDRAALAHCHERLAQPTEAIDAVDRASLLTTQAEILQRLGDLDAATQACQQAIGLLDTLELPGSSSPSSEETPERSQPRSERQRMAERAGAHNILGNGAYMRRNFAEAIEHYQQVVALREKLKDVLGIATTLNNLALAYAGQGQWPVAADCYGKALKIFTRIGDVAMVAGIQTNLGALWLAMGRVKEAEAAFLDAEARFVRLGNALGQASAASNLGQAALATGRGAVAVEHLERSLTLLETAGARAYAAEVLRRLGHAELLAGHPERAKEALERGTALAEAANNDEEAAILESLAAELRLRQGEVQGAVEQVDAAIERLRTCDPLEYGRALLRAAHIHQVAGDDRSAALFIAQATALFARLGATLDLAAAEALAEASGQTLARAIANPDHASSDASGLVEGVS